VAPLSSALVPRVTGSAQRSPPAARRELRASRRQLRRSVSARERLEAARRVAANADRAFPLRAGRRIALYCALDEELDTSVLVALARERGCEIYLPHIDDYRARRMSFRRETATLQCNRFGIPEPRGGEVLASRWLDVVFVPLVAFDERGVRLGMGAGFYDLALAWRHARRAWRGPLLVGLAYAFQQVPAIEPEAHDVHLDAVVTDQGVVRCSTG
jgi:5-formyltetrahydrofolate cyclo-ligase